MNTASRLAISCFLVGSTLLLSRLATSRESKPLARPLSSIARDIGGWSGADDAALPDRIAESLSATAYISRTYRDRGRSINLFVAYYANQRAGESMHSPKYCMPGGGWEMLDAGGARVLAGGRRFSVNNYLLQKSGERIRMLYWYQAPDHIIASEYAGKVLLVWDALRKGQTSGSIVRITLPDYPEALNDGLSFASQVIPEVARCFSK